VRGSPVAASASAPERYFEQLNEDFEAAAAVELHEGDLLVGERRVRLRLATDTDAEVLYPALSHLAVKTEGLPDVEFCIWDRPATRQPAARFPWGRDDLTLRGTIRPLCDERVQTKLEELSGALICWHGERRRLLCWAAAGVDDLPWAERSSPLRSAFGWALATRSMPFVHAGCVGRDGAGVLLVGGSGSGKSVTSLACAAAGLDYAGDDYVFVETGATPVAHGLYCTGRIHEYDIHRIPGLRDAVIGWVDGPGPKGVVDVRRLGRVRPTMRVRALVIPRVGGSATAIRRVRPAEALRAMAPSSIMQVPQADPHSALAALGRIARTLPAYVLELGGDAVAAARLVAEVCADG
jgi:hypothetical protein